MIYIKIVTVKSLNCKDMLLITFPGFIGMMLFLLLMSGILFNEDIFPPSNKNK